MRYVLMSATCLAALAASGCSQPQSSRSNDGPIRSEVVTGDMSNDSDAAAARAPGSGGPGVDVTAAPGVAFNYTYAFRLSADKIQAAQEAHAQACEKLGITQCRITGMRYRVNGENNIEGVLNFKLDPAVARKFGKDGIDAVVNAKGKLVEAEITGTDAGAAINRLKVQKGQADTELQRLDAQLARKDLKPDERIELQSQRATLVERINAVKTDTTTQQESLATTPMTFSYESGAAIQGFDESAPFTSAGNTFVGSATMTLGVVLTLLAALSPPGLILLIGFLLWRYFRRRRNAAAPPEIAPTA